VSKSSPFRNQAGRETAFAIPVSRLRDEKAIPLYNLDEFHERTKSLYEGETPESARE
jgi:hypothetical protein